MQSESFQISAEIARAEKDIEYTEQIETSKKDNIEDINNDIAKAKGEIESLTEKQSQSNKSITAHKLEKDKLSKNITKINEDIKESFSPQNCSQTLINFYLIKLHWKKK